MGFNYGIYLEPGRYENQVNLPISPYMNMPTLFNIREPYSMFSLFLRLRDNDL